MACEKIVVGSCACPHFTKFTYQYMMLETNKHIVTVQASTVCHSHALQRLPGIADTLYV